MYFDLSSGKMQKEAVRPVREEVAVARRSGKCNLAGRQLTSVPEALWSFASVKTDQDWWTLPPLERLDMSSNEITDAGLRPAETRGGGRPVSAEEREEQMLIFAALKYLDLGDNKLGSFPREIVATAKELTTLVLCSNAICELHVTPPLPPLTTLDLSKNQMSGLPEALAGLTSLRSLDASHNRISTVAPGLAFPHLITLNLAHNRLVSFPAFLSNVPELGTLDVSHNRLEGELLHEFPSLTRANLATNQLAVFPISLSKAPLLADLNLDHNSIAEIPGDRLGADHGISELRMNGNDLRALPQEFFAFPALSTLDLSFNNFRVLPNQLGLLPLRWLVYEGNPSRSPPPSVQGSAAVLKYLRARCENEAAGSPARPAAGRA
eukprot:CAMPEP_0119126838 /NCGR_PEP_ID=MMETSP1310-20130426/5603_1 /TAXON_ID=464262 /ORGANISM="Genus nov. species nov., Strain RCC2339" /LENGTH=379 /DNA_ID=CAMNT_0007117027 /DNA_START=142 /DNA_END=1278 /DNA_ORIENTATION=+